MSDGERPTTPPRSPPRAPRAQTPPGQASLPDDAIAAVIDQWPVGVIVAGPQGQLLYGNPEVARIWGRTEFHPAPSIDDFTQYRGLRADRTPLDTKEWPLARSLRDGEVVRAEQIHFERDDGTHGVMEVSSAPISIAGTIVGGVVLFVDVSERHESEVRGALLQRWTADLDSPDTAAVVAQLARELALVVAGSVDGVAVGEGGTITTDPDVERDPRIERAVELALARRAVVSDVDLDTDGGRAVFAVPLVVRGEVTGVVVHSGAPAQVDERAREIVTAVVRQGAHALERAWAVEDERAARRAEERARRRAERTAAIVTALEGVHGFTARVQALAEQLAVVADWCLIELAGGGDVVRVAAANAPGLADAVEILAAFPTRARDPATLAAESGHTVRIDVVDARVVDEMAHDQRHREALESLGVGSLAVVPFELDAESLAGAVLLVASQPRSIDDDDVALLEAVTGAVAPALERERARDRERRVAVTLQERLLPKELNTIDGALVAHRYRAGVDELLVGGDWIDTLVLPDGRLGLVVGDVVGRGVEAAATMGQLRAALLAIAMSGASPAQVLGALDDFVHIDPAGRSTTIVYAVADLDRGTVCYSCAGHIPPLLLDASGARWLDGAQGGPLGVWRGGRGEEHVELGLGATMVLLTDGLVERRHEPLDVGLERVRVAATGRHDDEPDTLCGALLDTVFTGTGAPHDDVAVLAMRRCDPATTFTYRIPAYPRALRSVRHALRAWLDRNGVETAVADDIVLACGEACANAMEHAYRDQPTGDVAVEANVSRDAVMCTVRDFGRWRAAGTVRPGGRGFGLMGELVDELDVRRSPWGTSVRLRRQIRR